jgi:aryl-alcohol dehydrogenase-like predicted oxidoreductase
MVYNPLAGGLLTGKHTFGEPTKNTRFDIKKNYVDRYWNEENFIAVEKLSKIAGENGMSLLELAAKWCLSCDYVDAVIMGVSRLEQFKQNMEAVEGEPLSADILEKCGEVWKSLAGTRYIYNR